MPALVDTQRLFRNAIVDGEVRGLARLLYGGRHPQSRLMIHRRNYEASLMTALLGKFPATVWLAGSRFLTDAARRYVRQCPPKAPCIAEYGEDFPSFLSSFDELPRIPYLRQFATLEWHLGAVSVATSSPPVQLDAFSRLDPHVLPDTRLVLQAGTRYLAVSWPIDILMGFYLTETAPDKLAFDPCDIWVEIRGSRGEFQINRLRKGEFTFRHYLWKGHSVGEASEEAGTIEDTFDPGRAFMNLIAAGLVSAIKPNKKDQTNEQY